MIPWLLVGFALLAAGAPARPFHTRAVRRVSRVVADLDRTANFYRAAFDAEPVGTHNLDPAILAALGLPDAEAEERVLRLGDTEIGLVRFATPGLPYPATRRSDDPWFQHLAIVVADIDVAYAHLRTVCGWQAIGTEGPQTLPAAQGRVRAFKFRDPEGHPLELIWFPPGQGRAIWRRPGRSLFRGIDHTALAVVSTARSLRFYRALGFRVAARSHNQGPAQTRLDALPDVDLRVTGLRPRGASGPGLELLEYAGSRPPRDHAIQDIATDWTTLLTRLPPGAPPILLRDPDGHRLLLSPT